MEKFDNRHPNVRFTGKTIDPHLLIQHKGSRIDIATASGESFSLQIQKVKVTNGRKGALPGGKKHPVEERLVKLCAGVPVLDTDKWGGAIEKQSAAYRILPPHIIQEGRALVLQERRTRAHESFMVVKCDFLTVHDIAAAKVAARKEAAKKGASANKKAAAKAQADDEAA